MTHSKTSDYTELRHSICVELLRSGAAQYASQARHVRILYVSACTTLVDFEIPGQKWICRRTGNGGVRRNSCLRVS